MQELEKVLDEIKAASRTIVMADMPHKYYKAVGTRKIEEILRKHMNDGWIPVDERLPEVNTDIEETIEDEDCPEYNVTIRGASESTTLKYSPDGTWFDDNGHIYDVIAWQPLPEIYRPERSEENETD